MDVTFVIPVHNSREALTETLESVFAQTGIAFEVLAVDDGSADGADVVLRRYSTRGLRVLSLPGNFGVSYARNRGIESALGDYLAFVDVGDVLMPGMLERVVGILQDSPDIVVGGYRLDVRDDLAEIDAVGEEPFDDGILEMSTARGTFTRRVLPRFLANLLQTDLFHALAGKFYRRDLLRDVRFDESVFQLLEDELFNIGVFANASVVRSVSEPLCFVNTSRRGALSTTFDDDREFNLRKLFKAYDRLLALFDGAEEAGALAAELDKQRMLHSVGLFANWKRASSFADPSAMLYVMSRVLNSSDWWEAACRSGLEKEWLVSLFNTAVDSAFSLLRRCSFLNEAHGNAFEHLLNAYLGLEWSNKSILNNYTRLSEECGAKPIYTELVRNDLWSGFPKSLGAD